MIIPSVVAAILVYAGGTSISGVPKSGLGPTLLDHFGIFLAGLATLVVASWLIVPFGFIAMRAAAMLGWAGWGTAILTALGFGLPIVHFALNGDLTTEDASILPHIAAAIAFLGLSAWAAFWGLVAVCKNA